jgi:hypothetical protein
VAHAREFLGEEEAGRLLDHLIEAGGSVDAAIRKLVALARARGMPGLASRRWCPLCNGTAASAAKH